MKRVYIAPKLTKYDSLSSLPGPVRNALEQELDLISGPERTGVNSIRPLALRIVEMIEHYHLENACLRLLLKQNFVARWPQKLQTLLDDPKLAADILEQLGPMRRAVTRSTNPAEQLDALSHCFQSLGTRRDRE